MTALAADRNTPSRAGDVVVLPVRSSAATTIYAGSLVCADAYTGNALPAGVAGSTSSDPVFIGVAEETVANPSGGALTVRVRRRGVFRVASANDFIEPYLGRVGKMAYAVDDQTIGAYAVGRPPVGRIVETETATTAWVAINEFSPLALVHATPAEAVDALTGTLTGTANGALVDIAAAAGACAGDSTPTAGNVDTAIATAVAPMVSGVNEQLKELQTTLNAVITALQTAGLMQASE